nr:uncharacterized protein LOC129265143 [Lytechinus pictus]
MMDRPTRVLRPRVSGRVYKHDVDKTMDKENRARQVTRKRVTVAKHAKGQVWRERKRVKSNGVPTVQISDDDMAFLMRQKNVDKFFDPSVQDYDYHEDIVAYLKERETLLDMSREASRSSVQPLHREVLIDWLTDVQAHLELENATLHLAIALIDAYAMERIISVHSLQLVGITCLFVASKYEDVYVPSVSTLCMLCASCYKESDLLKMEPRILRTLEYSLFFPTAVDFLPLFFTLADIENETLVFMCNYLVDLTLPFLHSMDSRPSIWAAAAIFLSLTIRRSHHLSNNEQKNPFRMNNCGVWSLRLQTVTRYGELSMTNVARKIVEKVLESKTAKLQAPYKKHNKESFQFISEDIFQWCSDPANLISNNLEPLP